MLVEVACPPRAPCLVWIIYLKSNGCGYTPFNQNVHHHAPCTMQAERSEALLAAMFAPQVAEPDLEQKPATAATATAAAQGRCGGHGCVRGASGIHRADAVLESTNRSFLASVRTRTRCNFAVCVPLFSFMRPNMPFAAIHTRWLQ